jgi:hypothetical protein
LKRKQNFDFFAVLAFTVLGFVVMGYHPGLEDDGIYLTAVKARLNTSLYPHDANFFRLQMQATVFDRWMAHFIQWSGVSVAWAELLWQFAALFLILWACRRIAAQLFQERSAQWAAVAMVAAMFTLPVAGTALYIADQHLHPRILATALTLIAVSRILDGKRWQAVPLMLLAVVLHPIMAAMGISFCFFLMLFWQRPLPLLPRKAFVAAVPLGWMFEPPSPSWREAMSTRTCYYLSRWTWYEWLGALAPLFLFWLLWRVARRRGETPLARFSLAVFAFGLVQQTVALIMLAPTSLVRLMPLQPMRYLQLVYLFMALLGGGLLGRFLLQRKLGSWAIYLLLINGSMFLVQGEGFGLSAHLEMPWMQSSNPWIQAFKWIRQNTPKDAYFALDPRYLAAPGEGYRSFRALAERSQLADSIKDTSVVTQVPELGPVWKQQVDAQAGWSHFQLADFERLKAEFGVNWVVVSNPEPAGLACSWRNSTVSVCRIL